MKIFMMLLLLACGSQCFSAITDSNNIATDGLLSNGEYGGLVKVKEDSVLTVNGGGAEDIYLYDKSSLTVLSTSEPFVDYESGITVIMPSDYSSVTVSGGVVNSIYVKKDATVLLDGGQINYIRTAQYASAGITITIDCQINNWSWIGEEENYTGITGYWHNGDEFTIEFLNADVTLIPDTWTHVQVIPEPASMLLLGLGCVIYGKRKMS